MEALHEVQQHPIQSLDYEIGNTPLQPIILSIQGIPHVVHLKLESFNPTHSMKDRTAYGLIQALENQGKLQDKSTIVESTSGNLGVAMARLCQLKGYKFLAIVDPKTTEENIIKLQTFGAQVEIVRQLDKNGGYLLSRLARVQQILIEHPDYVWTNQYDNPANPSVHCNSTGPEIYAQMQQQVGAVFVPVSTGGTLAGIGDFFRAALPAAQIIGVDAFGSVIFGTPPTSRKLTGIGSSRRSTFIRNDLYDDFILIKDEEAFAFCRFLFKSTGIFVGGSSGAVLAACARYIAQHRDLNNIVCVCADHGENYRSSIFNDVWLKEQKLELTPTHLTPVEDIYCQISS